MLETIREYAVERLEASTEAVAVQTRYADFFAALAESANLCVEAVDEGRLPRIELVLPDQANLRATLDWALEGDPELGLRLAAFLEQFWVMQNPFEGMRRFEALLGRAPGASPLLRARALRCLGGSSVFAGDYARAIGANKQALELYREAGDEVGEMTMIFRLGSANLNLGEIDRARGLLEESLAGFRRVGKKMGECEASGELASLELDHGDARLGRVLLEQNIELAREVGFTWWEAGKLHHLAEHAIGAGELEEGERRAREALELHWRMDDRSGKVYDLAILAWAAAERRDAHRAGKLWGPIEAEETRGPVGRGWEAQRGEYASHLASVAGPEFEQARREGSRLSLDEAVEYALGSLN